VRLESVPSEGSEFIVQLPVLKADSDCTEEKVTPNYQEAI
jgi:hypothetical protein